LPSASVVIPTFNRKDCLREALRSSFAQTVPVEAIVIDDGSTDGTEEMMRQEFPDVRYERRNGPNGPCVLRNRGSELATSPILFPIDDDAVFASPRTIEQTLAEFDHPRIAAVGIPFINVQKDDSVIQQAPDDSKIYVTEAFVGASHAIRRDRFLAAGGYRSRMFYMGEEGDLAIRLLDRGWLVRLGRADPIHHFESPKRVLTRADLFGRQNDVLFAWYNVPMPYFPLHLLGATVAGLRYGFRCRRPLRMVLGLAMGYRAIIDQFSQRRPVHPGTYRLRQMLRAQGIVPLSEIEPLLPKMPDIATANAF